MSISETKNHLHATGYVSQGGNGQTGNKRRPISLHATTIFKSAIRVSLKRKKEREKERLEMESTCCAITQSHGSLHRPRNRNKPCWCNKSRVWKICGSSAFEYVSNHGKESNTYIHIYVGKISVKMLILRVYSKEIRRQK